MTMFFGQNTTAPRNFVLLRKAAVFLACLILNFTLTKVVTAEEIVVTVTDNGSGSSNQVQVTNQNNTTVTQNNEANINNNVDTNANTGNNDASLNGNGETTVVTGDATSTTSVNNQNINTNSAVTNCNCSTDTTTTISGNGSGSYNSAGINNTTNTIIGQSNYATINNNITVNANTGNNKASFNGGNSTIVTGNIWANTTVNNKNINNSFYDGDQIMFSAQVKIDGNGANSYNSLNLSNNSNVVITDTNIANIINNIEQNLNTGGNETLKNLGDSAIITGDIISNITVNNENINSSFVHVDCDCEKAPEGPKAPPPATTPTNPTINPGVSYVQPSSGNSGSSGPAAGAILPATGATIPFTLVASLVLFFMLLSGLYLRFHASHAPPAK